MRPAKNAAHSSAAMIQLAAKHGGIARAPGPFHAMEIMKSKQPWTS